MKAFQSFIFRLKISFGIDRRWQAAQGKTMPTGRRNKGKNWSRDEVCTPPFRGFGF